MAIWSLSRSSSGAGRPAAWPQYGAGRPLEELLVGQAGVAGALAHAAPVGVAAVDRGLRRLLLTYGPAIARAFVSSAAPLTWR